MLLTKVLKSRFDGRRSYRRIIKKDADTMPRNVSVRPVKTRKDLSTFLSLPYRLYRHDSLWAPPIRLFERREFRKGSNPVLSRSPHTLLIAEDSDGILRGRIIAYEDPRYNAHYGGKTGFFGFFEADDPESAAALFDTAEKWFASRALTEILGPIDPVAECWGFTIDGFEKPPVFMSPYNPPSYPAWIEAAGYRKAKDLLVYEVDSRKGYEIPPRFQTFEQNFFSRNPGFSVRTLRTKNFNDDVKSIVDILNLGVADNWGFVPVEDDERDAMAEKLKLVVDPAAVWFIEDKGRPVACCLGFPDLNIPIRAGKGRLLPLGWLNLMRARSVLADYRLWGLAVLPEYQGRGLDALIYINLYRALSVRKPGTRLEANYVLEDNPRIINALEKLGMEKIKTYRVFRKSL